MQVPFEVVAQPKEEEEANAEERPEGEEMVRPIPLRSRGPFAVRMLMLTWLRKGLMYLGLTECPTPTFIHMP